MMFIFIVSFAYFLFFKTLSNPKLNFYSVLLIVDLALIIRLRSVFIFLALFLAIIFFIGVLKRKRIKDFIILFLLLLLSSSFVFIISGISISDYFLIDGFHPENIKNIVYYFYQFPREKPMLVILFIFLLSTNIFYGLSSDEKNNFNKFDLINSYNEMENNPLKEVWYVIIPELLIFFIFFILFSDGNLSTSGLYLGLFPFIPLNIIYLFIYLDRFSLKNRNIILILFGTISMIETINGIIYRLINNKLF